MTAINQKTTIKLQLCLKKERNTERGATEKKGRSLRKAIFFHRLCYKRQSMRYKNQVLSGRWLQHHSLLLEATAKGRRRPKSMSILEHCYVPQFDKTTPIWAKTKRVLVFWHVLCCQALDWI
jgi:hypothetical protein